MLLVWLEIFAAAWLSTSKLLEGTAQEHSGRRYIVVVELLKEKCDGK